MISVLVDTNVILDYVLAREPFCSHAERIFAHAFLGKVECCLSASAVTDLYYIMCKSMPRQNAVATIRELFKVIRILPVNGDSISLALNQTMRDFEDAVQVAAANACDVDCIITRDAKDFVDSGLTVYSPEDYVNLLSI
ncbi:MAG: type II toxin-antitoxin system VapC family toxin [Thermoguttaceae bacterium]